MLIKLLQKHSGLSLSQIERYAATASKRYKVYVIPKRTKGYRTIAQPSRAIKSIQRWINKSLIIDFPIHSSATAYSKGSKIVDNAAKHVNSNFTLHLDFNSFFPSFSGKHVENFLREKSGCCRIALSEEDISFVRRIVCRYEELTIGAPSSPLLTNAMMYDFDESISSWCENNGLIYTRYADDLFVSANKPGALAQTLAHISEEANAYRFACLRLNEEKTAFLSRRYRRSITGLIVTPTHNLSIGRDRKEQIKGKIYEYKQGRLGPIDRAHLRGMLAFVMDVEPNFYSTLIRKYGQTTLDHLRAGAESSAPQ